MSSRMRRPETARLEISRGDWLLVKKHLTAGEMRRLFGRMMRAGGNTIDPVRVGLSKCLSYLLDWSITDADDKPVVIRDQPEDVVSAALDALDADSFAEILQAVEAHEAAMEKAVTEEMARPTPEIASSAISPSAA